ncbi:hypothetical protein Vafri_21732 [Volvox africanus]|uniref:Uncharacterized protein n=1 Tax=Volvox africanus TaxID=51714 RepID=A0A8J4BZE4_9CHLO|nr:hypothetical protein Vafri_21732 [Volvox africanus]
MRELHLSPRCSNAPLGQKDAARGGQWSPIPLIHARGTRKARSHGGHLCLPGVRKHAAQPLHHLVMRGLIATIPSPIAAASPASLVDATPSPPPMLSRAVAIRMAIVMAPVEFLP